MMLLLVLMDDRDVRDVVVVKACLEVWAEGVESLDRESEDGLQSAL